MARKPKKTEEEYEDEVEADVEENENMSDKMFGGSVDDLHPFVVGLLQELPKPGEAWEQSRRQLWINTATSIFQMIYQAGEPEGPKVPGAKV